MKLTKAYLKQLIQEELEIHFAPENLTELGPEEAYGLGYQAKETYDLARAAETERKNLQEIIQEELEKMLNEEIQEEELPVTYRIPDFIRWLDSKDAKLVGPDEVMWRQNPRYPATKTTLRIAWQAYKKEKFNL